MDMAYNYNRFPLELIPEIIAHPEDYRIQSRVPYARFADEQVLPVIFRETPEPVQSLVFLEMVTTGGRRQDVILELVMVKCSCLLSTGEIVSVDRMYRGFEAPRYPIPAYITRTTGITVESINGMSFDYRTVDSMLRDDPIIVSTRGRTAREFFERRFSSFSGYRWVDSVHDIRWENLNDRLISGATLQMNCERLGFFFRYNSIREAVFSNLWLFSYIKGSIAELIATSSHVEYMVWAFTARFEVKEELKFNGYLWNGEQKCWCKRVFTEEEVKEEQEYLRGKCSSPEAIKIEVLDSRKKHG